MKRKDIDLYFRSSIGEQCNSLFSTPDDMVFIRKHEAIEHCTLNDLNSTEIVEWFND